MSTSEGLAKPAIKGYRPTKAVTMSTTSGVIVVKPWEIYTDELAIERLRRHGIELEPVYDEAGAED